MYGQKKMFDQRQQDVWVIPALKHKNLKSPKLYLRFVKNFKTYFYYNYQQLDYS